MTRRRGLVWKNFLVLMSCISALILVITFLIYQNAIDVMKEELCNMNMYRVSQVSGNLSRMIGQTHRLAASICTRSESSLFAGVEKPEEVDEDFYNRLYSNLKTYAYSLNDYISSIVLYSPAYGRIIANDLSSPYVFKGTQRDQEQNIDWIEGLDDLSEEQMRTTMKVRAVGGRYPYVMTLIKQYKVNMGWLAVAVDINLENAHSVICPEEMDDMSIWVLDEEGRVIIREKKSELYADAALFDELGLFERSKSEKSVLNETGDVPITYAQKYLEEYGLYVVVATRLQDFNMQMHRARLYAIGIGLGCVAVACVLVWLYVSFVNKPIKSILNLLQNPMNYDSFIEQSEHEVQEIVDRIVSNMQLNDALRKELDKRLDLLHQAQLQALKAQINPHFLFNTLNVIVMLMDEVVEDSCAAQVTVDLADVLHYSLSDNDLVSLREELEHTRKYVFILEQRYRGNFQAQFNIAEELMEVKVPKLILQPLIENAVFHGIVAREECIGGELLVTGRKELCTFDQEEMWAVKIDIQDNGQGIAKKDMEKIKESLKEEYISMNHIGVQNVAKRLDLLFSHKSRLDIQSKEGEGTCVTLWFPYMEAQKE